MTASIQPFADRHNLRVSTDKADGTRIVKGRSGHVYEYSDDRLGVIYMSENLGKANNRRRECAKAGMEIVQDCETEFAAAFDPEDQKQCKLAIRVAGCKRKRILSDAQREQLKAARAVSPLLQRWVKPVENGPLTA